MRHGTNVDGSFVHHQTQNSELRVRLGSAEHGGWVVGDLWGTLDINPNPNGILPLQHMQNVVRFKNAVISGVVGVQCAQHGFYMPCRIVDLKKGKV